MEANQYTIDKYHLFYLTYTWLAKICNVKDDPYLRIMTSLNKDFSLEIKHYKRKIFSQSIQVYN